MKELLLLLLIGISFAVPACPQYPYHDYVQASGYHTPQKPTDTLLQYCSFNFNQICILTNVLNTTEDKKQFVAEAIANNSFDSILQWNQKIPFGKWFNVTKSSANIKDAWVSLAYFSPSVYDNGTYLLNSTSKTVTKENFTFVVNEVKLGTDCKDVYRICGYDYAVSTKNTASSITANLNVKSEYLVDRYVLTKHCSKFGCSYTCDYSFTQSFKDGLSVSDSEKIRYENFTPDSNYSIVAYYNGLAELLINANNSKVHFQIGNSTFDKQNYVYRTRYELEPYNILVKELVPVNKTSNYYLRILDWNNSQFHILAPYSENCSLTVQDHFNSKIISGCNISNFTNSSSIQKVTATPPTMFDLFSSLAGFAIISYAMYEVAKKVIFHD